MRFIIYLLLFYLVFKLFSKLVYVYLVKKVAKKQNQYQDKRTNNKREGDVSIDKIPKSNSKKSDKLGDYVDYEEID